MGFLIIVPGRSEMEMAAPRTYALRRVQRPGTFAAVEVELLAREAGVHPDVVRRLVRLGLIESCGGDAAAQLAKAVRLRRDLGLNYAGAVLACELLARIAELEARAR
jgi:hypothetical protein